MGDLVESEEESVELKALLRRADEDRIRDHARYGVYILSLNKSSILILNIQNKPIHQPRWYLFRIEELEGMSAKFELDLRQASTDRISDRVR